MTKKVQTAIGIAGGLIGLAAYLYLLGGLVTWLRLTAARLPADDALRALDGRRLLAVGMKALFFELVLMAALLGLTWVTWALISRGHDTEEGDSREEEGWLAWILVLQAVVAGLLAGALEASVFDARLDPIGIGLMVGGVWMMASPFVAEWLARRARLKKYLKIGLTAVAAGVAFVLLEAPAGIAVLVLLLFMHLSHFLARLPKKLDPVRLVPAVLTLAAGLSLVVAAYLATPPVAFDTATVRLDKGRKLTGGYIGQSGDGVFLGTCMPQAVDPKISRASRLRIVPANRVASLVLGGQRYVYDYGKSPSLLDLGLFFVQPGEIEQNVEGTVAVDVREAKLTCGLQQLVQLKGRTREAGRPAVQRVMVHGAGSLFLDGPSVLPQVVIVDRALEVPLLLRLDPAVERARRCTGPFETSIEVSFWLRDGETESRQTSLTLPTADRRCNSNAR